ncbi:GUN4 domain-containing protein [Prochlorococcus sp. MIT 1307]|uniref:GUN4 domain-containing protein n=1 Tax=Prochlorococcus sp. MIT 1307 TaxID=3096219 RepID=UPI002A763C72|nr:GUN4 domain-containing protein [Prochlorococcus sp. MIT 1307]
MLSENSHSSDISIEELLEQFSNGSSRKRRGLIKSIEARAKEIALLGPDALAPFSPQGDDWAAGWILQVIHRNQPDAISKLISPDSTGWFHTESLEGIDYASFQSSLLSENFEDADRFTSAILRQLAGPEAEERGYVYFSEVGTMSGVDLVTLDRLWFAYSQGRFGFSIQARLLNSLGGRYDRLWPRIGWKENGVWTRYPHAFSWSITAPEGHMPLVNQLRGVRLMDALLNHPALLVRREEGTSGSTFSN